MSLLDHLEELRRVLLFSIAATAAGAVLGWVLGGPVLAYVGRPMGILHFAALTEAFTTRVKVALVLGFLITLPAILYRVWRFVAPALYRRERRVFLPLVSSSLVLFYLGMAFAFFVVRPMIVRFFLRYSLPGHLEPIIMVGDYFGFLAKLTIAFGLVFQLPLVVCVLSLAGILDPAALGRQWRYAVVIAFTVGAILTPPDVMSQILMSVPLLALYLASVGVSGFLVGRRATQAAAAAARAAAARRGDLEAEASISS